MELRAVAESFAIEGELVEAAPYGNGHIHDTFLAVYQNGGGRSRFIHQRLNRRVFPRTDVVMRNIAAVTRHVRRRLLAEATEDLERRVAERVEGTKIDRSRSAAHASMRGNARWLSARARPWPGTCLMTGRTPPARQPSITACPSAITVSGSVP